MVICVNPYAKSSLAMAIPADPAPFMMTLHDFFCLPVTFKAFIIPARTTMAVLIVVEHRDIEDFFEPLFNFKAPGGGDIF